MIDVVSVYAPRRRNAHFMDYMPMFKAQQRTCEKFGHRQVIVTDDPAAVAAAGFETISVSLPKSLMFALMAGQLAWLENWTGADHTVLVDADVLIGRDLASAFTGEFDIGITNRNVPESPVNNGAIYVDKAARQQALDFWTRAYQLVGDHWGGDQEAIAKAAAPVPLEDHGIEVRSGARIAFLPCSKYNMTPGVNGAAGTGKPYAIHFKGERKHRMADYARAYIL